MGDWIPCSERLPADAAYVLVWIPKGAIRLAHGVFVDYSAKGRGIWWLIHNRLRKGSVVSHWAPRIPPPTDHSRAEGEGA